MSLRASIDIGSNTVLLLIANVQENPFSFEEIFNESYVTSLGKNLDTTGLFEQSSINETYKALSDYKNKIESVGLKPEDVIVTATEASRVAKNSKEFFDKVLKELGLKVTIINAEGEAFYTCYGITGGKKIEGKNSMIMDIGGASTELISISVKPFKVIDTISLPIGSVRGTDWKLAGCFEEKIEQIFGSYEIKKFKTDHLICVAGSMTSLAGMVKGLKSFDASEVNNSAISFDSYNDFLEGIRKLSPDDLLKKYPFLGKRSSTIIAGAEIGLKIGETLGVKSFEVSTFGLRYGTVFSGRIESKYGEL